MRAVVLLVAAACWAQTIQTGPEVGTKIPTFRLIDQHGREQTLETLRGPNGLVLAFVRSADW